MAKEDYTIFITIDKLLFEGGKLRKGRSIYTRSSANKNIYTYYGDYIKWDRGLDVPIVKTPSATAPASVLSLYVEIKVIPVFK